MPWSIHDFLLLVSDSCHKGKITEGLIADSYWNKPSRRNTQNDGEKYFKLNRVAYIQVHFWLFRESISIIPLHAGYHRLLVHICLVRMGITANMWPFSPNLYIWKVFFSSPSHLSQIHLDLWVIILWHESDTWYSPSKLLSFPIWRLYRTSWEEEAGGNV